jgi:hypothetical protein
MIFQKFQLNISKMDPRDIDLEAEILSQKVTQSSEFTPTPTSKLSKSQKKK